MANALQDTNEQQAPAKAKPLLHSALGPAEVRRNYWHATLPAGVTAEQIAQPTFWAACSDRIQFLDRVDAVIADRSGYFELLCMDSGRGFANMHVLNFYALPALLTSDPNALPSGFECTYSGPVVNGEHGYIIVRVCDGCVITQGHHSRESALTELLNHASLR